MSDVAHNIEVIRNKIEDASKGKDVTLVAVSKTVEIPKIIEAIECGQKVFGENRIQELQNKMQTLSNYDLEWHFIGGMQKNKIKYTQNGIFMIQSLDSDDLLIQMQNFYSKHDVIMNCLLQVNIGFEPQKSGISPEKVIDFVSKIQYYNNIRLLGLMCIPPYDQNPRKYFAEMKTIFENIKQFDFPNVDMHYLSMGMTHDFEDAIREGANMVRIGTAIFGERL